MVRAISVVAILAVIALSAVVQPPPISRTPPTRQAQPAVALTALTQPLAPTPDPVAFPQPLELLGQQVNFHIAFVRDFVSTGAVLFAREFAIPGTLLNDIQNGTPLPDALGRALVDFAQVEIDAGRELVRFAVQYVTFQVQFVGDVLREVIAVATAIPTAVTGFFAGLTPQPSTERSEPAQAMSIRAADTTAAVTPRHTSARPSTHADAVERKVASETATASHAAEQRTPRTAVTHPTDTAATRHGPPHPRGHDEVHTRGPDSDNAAPSKKANAVP